MNALHFGIAKFNVHGNLRKEPEIQRVLRDEKIVSKLNQLPDSVSFFAEYGPWLGLRRTQWYFPSDSFDIITIEREGKRLTTLHRKPAERFFWRGRVIPPSETWEVFINRVLDQAIKICNDLKLYKPE